MVTLLVAAAFCSCGYTSAQVRTWNDNALATPAGQHRIDLAVQHEVAVNPPADAPFITQTGRVVKSRARGIRAHTLGWFKAVYKRCPDKSPGCRAMRNCLIAGYSTYTADRLSGLSVKRSLRDATLSCIVAAFATLAGRQHVGAVESAGGVARARRVRWDAPRRHLDAVTTSS